MLSRAASSPVDVLSDFFLTLSLSRRRPLDPAPDDILAHLRFPDKTVKNFSNVNINTMMVKQTDGKNGLWSLSRILDGTWQVKKLHWMKFSNWTHNTLIHRDSNIKYL